MRSGWTAIGIEFAPDGWHAVHLRTGWRGYRLLARETGAYDSNVEPARAAALALARACEAFKAGPGTRLGVALARPLVHLKRIGFPPAGQSRLLGGLEENANSLFPVGRKSVLADLRVRRSWSRLRPADGLGAVAAEELIEAIAGAAEGAGLNLIAVDPSSAVIGRYLGRESRAVALVHGHGLELAVYSPGGELRSSRYVPVTRRENTAHEAAEMCKVALAVAGEEPALPTGQNVLAIGAEEHVDLLDRAAKASDLGNRLSLAAWEGTSCGCQFAVAWAAAVNALGNRRTFDLRPYRLRRLESARGKRRTGILLVAAVAAMALYAIAGVQRFAQHVDVMEAEVKSLEPLARDGLALEMQAPPGRGSGR